MGKSQSAPSHDFVVQSHNTELRIHNFLERNAIDRVEMWRRIGGIPHFYVSFSNDLSRILGLYSTAWSKMMGATGERGSLFAMVCKDD